MTNSESVERTGLSNAIDQLRTAEDDLPPAVASAAVLRGITAALQASMASIGECRVEVPFSTLRPILENDGDSVRWCCNHETTHWSS